MRTKIVTLTTVIFALLFPSINAFTQQPISPQSKEYLSKINPKVQLKENSWLKIVNEFVIEESPEQYYSKIYDDDKLRKDSIKRASSKIFKTLYVDIQFLKPCNATKLKGSHPLSIFDITSPEWIDIVISKFRCDYRLKVFVTFFSSEGNEIKTGGIYPIALWTDSLHIKRKTEMLPGEKIQVSFLIPEEVKYWHVWVPM